MLDDVMRLARGQAGLVTRAQLAALGVDRRAVGHRVDDGTWAGLTPTVIGVGAGRFEPTDLSREQLRWLGVLHGGDQALVGDLSAAELAGLKNWHRSHVTILISPSSDVGTGFPGIEFVRSRHPLADLRRPGAGIPACRIEPAVLRFASVQRSARTAEGVLAATVQQRLSTPERLAEWIDRLRPLRGAPRFRRTLGEIAAGAPSVSELDVRRLCSRFGLAPPQRQVRRRDGTGRVRYTDCEWRLADGRLLVLEVDEAFHMDAEHWADDLAWQRGLSRPDPIIVRCTAREARDEQDRLALDLRMLGVPAA